MAKPQDGSVLRASPADEVAERDRALRNDLAARRAKRLAGLHEAFGVLKHRTDIPDGVIYQRKLRSEW